MSAEPEPFGANDRCAFVAARPPGLRELTGWHQSKNKKKDCGTSAAGRITLHDGGCYQVRWWAGLKFELIEMVVCVWQPAWIFVYKVKCWESQDMALSRTAAWWKFEFAWIWVARVRYGSEIMNWFLAVDVNKKKNKIFFFVKQFYDVDLALDLTRDFLHWGMSEESRSGYVWMCRCLRLRHQVW